MKILLIGKNGQIGGELAKRLPSLGQVIAIGREDCDLTDRAWVRTTVRMVEPGIIVNAAGYTDVDRAEDERDLAWAVNAMAPAVLADEAVHLGSALVHYSTHYVFDGAKQKPYSEDDAPKPLNVYGATKLEGEQAIQARGAAALILRTSWVYGLSYESFVSKVFRQAAAGSELRVPADQISRPTWSLRLARATVEILRQCMQWRDFPENRRGVFHLASSGATSRYGWAKAILHHVVKDPPRLVPSMSDEKPRPAERPGYSALDCSKVHERFGIHMPDWRDDLSLALSTRHLPEAEVEELAMAYPRTRASVTHW